MEWLPYLEIAMLQNTFDEKVIDSYKNKEQNQTLLFIFIIHFCLLLMLSMIMLYLKQKSASQGGSATNLSKENFVRCLVIYKLFHLP